MNEPPHAGVDRTPSEEASHQYQGAFESDLKVCHNVQTLGYWRNLQVLGPLLKSGTNHYAGPSFRKEYLKCPVLKNGGRLRSFTADGVSPMVLAL